MSCQPSLSRSHVKILLDKVEEVKGQERKEGVGGPPIPADQGLPARPWLGGSVGPSRLLRSRPILGERESKTFIGHFCVREWLSPEVQVPSPAA